MRVAVRGFLRRIIDRIRGLAALWAYKRAQRRQLKKQKSDDPNIYPLW